MKKLLVLISLLLVIPLCLVACAMEKGPLPDDTTEQTTPEITTPEETTPEETTPEETTPEETTEEKVQIPEPSMEELKEKAVAFLDAAAMKEAADNPQQDWSDFGGLSDNPDGSVTALFRMGTNDVWDPYCYLLKQDTTVGDIMVIKYQIKYDFRVKLYMGTEGNAATGAGDLFMTEFFATEGDEWGYLIVNMAEEVPSYDKDAAALGYLRLGLDMAESGDTVTIMYIAFFNTMDEVNELIPY